MLFQLLKYSTGFPLPFIPFAKYPIKKVDFTVQISKGKRQKFIKKLFLSLFQDDFFYIKQNITSYMCSKSHLWKFTIFFTNTGLLDSFFEFLVGNTSILKIYKKYTQFKYNDFDMMKFLKHNESPTAVENMSKVLKLTQSFSNHIQIQFFMTNLPFGEISIQILFL